MHHSMTIRTDEGNILQSSTCISLTMTKRLDVMSNDEVVSISTIPTFKFESADLAAII